MQVATMAVVQYRTLNAQVSGSMQPAVDLRKLLSYSVLRPTLYNQRDRKWILH